ncbi:cobalamin biosynthesis protein [Acuticoccus sp.]|uniref:cobalamin biosynthesis protein n=1 Tax=Acuticoccus sp. TaxID=1904378 RepID=UPI003B518B47
MRDGARRHASPNAGWPEAALAAALGVALGGPRRYGAREVGGVWLNPAGRPPRRTDIRRGLRASRDVGIAQLAIYAGLALL